MPERLPRLRLRCARPGKPEPVEVSGFTCFAAGYTGRNREAIDAHIHELEEHGIARPKRVPSCFPLLPHLVTAGARRIDVYGPSTSGEIEPVLILLDGRPAYVAVGSDHTDREMERHSIPHSKQSCPKVISRDVWPYELVAERWDDLTLRSWSDGELYQSARLSAMLPVDQLIATVPPERRGGSVVLFCGTVALAGPLRFGSHFKGSLGDPEFRKSLTVSYDVTVLEPID